MRTGRCDFVVMGGHVTSRMFVLRYTFAQDVDIVGDNSPVDASNNEEDSEDSDDDEVAAVRRGATTPMPSSD